ncbi:GtrA family protein [Methylobrevis pamukkalensis]|uniref:GtrA-like protein n=1 Tax=Methylobrevis pamukkalensis TaxID=1439726 RepID=A0A1E3H2H1_9HYPH|nr:GtrA-like protein [Methylobrevis pamukkalensis]
MRLPRATVIRLLRFAAVGGTGFLVDAGVTLALAASGLSPFLARVGGIGVAILVTWALNRRFTFADRRNDALAAEGSRYGLVALASCLVNYLAYALLLLALPDVPLGLAVAFGSGVAMVVSYLAIRASCSGRRADAFRSRPRARDHALTPRGVRRPGRNR